MTLPPKTRALLLLLLLPAVATAQTSAPAAPAAAASPHKRAHIKPSYQAPYNPDTIVLDAAHGGQDNGANLGSAGLEKDFTIAFANRLNTLLSAKGFTVVLTHAASSDETTPDQRVDLANRSRAVACLILHATPAGRGVHLFTSALTSPSSFDQQSDAIALWDSAQAASLPKSLQLANELATSLNGLRVPLVVGRASVRPIDSMSCPAVAVEIAPAAAESSLDDDAYQQRIADSLVTALTFWRQHAQEQIAAQIAAQNPAAATGTPPTAPTPKPKPKPKPVIITSPDEVPLAPDNASPDSTHKPAPIVRKPPPPPSANPPGAQL